MNTATTAPARALPGMPSTNSPAPSTRPRVWAPLSITTATLGGEKSRGMAQEAAMTLRRPWWALLTRVTGPWLSSL